MQKLRKAAMTVALIFVLSVFGTIAVSADTTTDSGTGTVDATIPVTGTISAVTISVTHPLAAAYQVDTDADSVTAPEINITNNTKCALNVTVDSITSTGDFVDVLPTAKDWSKLTLSESKKYIAFGLKAESSEWDSGYVSDTDWAANKTAVTFGSLQSGATGKLSMVANNGPAIDAATTDSHQIVFSFSLK